ncbi:hypothetical protein LEMLEM_LOCUS4998 [Lemmus lemmus]
MNNESSHESRENRVLSTQVLNTQHRQNRVLNTQVLNTQHQQLSAWPIFFHQFLPTFLAPFCSKIVLKETSGTYLHIWNSN